MLHSCSLFRFQNPWRVLRCDEFTVLTQVQDQCTVLLPSLEGQQLHMYLHSHMHAALYIGQTPVMF